MENTIQELQLQSGRYLLVGNKIDSVNEAVHPTRFWSGDNILYISARVGAHMDNLKSSMLHAVLQEGMQTENTIVTNARHYGALAEVNGALQDVLAGWSRMGLAWLASETPERCFRTIWLMPGGKSRMSLVLQGIGAVRASFSRDVF